MDDSFNQAFWIGLARQAEHRLRLVRRENPELFAHWYLLRASNV